MFVYLKRGLYPVCYLNSLGETLLYVDLIDLYTAVEHYVKVLVGVKADLVLICVQVREAVVDRNIAEALLDEGVEALEGGLLELYYLVL